MTQFVKVRSADGNVFEVDSVAIRQWLAGDVDEPSKWNVAVASASSTIDETTSRPDTDAQSEIPADAEVVCVDVSSDGKLTFDVTCSEKSSEAKKAKRKRAEKPAKSEVVKTKRAHKEGDTLPNRLMALLNVNGTLSPAEMAKELGEKLAAVNATCFRLTKDGRLRREGRGQYSVNQNVPVNSDECDASSESANEEAAAE